MTGRETAVRDALVRSGFTTEDATRFATTGMSQTRAFVNGVATGASGQELTNPTRGLEFREYAERYFAGTLDGFDHVFPPSYILGAICGFDAYLRRCEVDAAQLAA